MKYILLLTTFLLMLPSAARSLRKAIKFAAMKIDIFGAVSKSIFVWRLVLVIISSAVKALSLFASRKSSISFFKFTEPFSNSFRLMGDVKTPNHLLFQHGIFQFLDVFPEKSCLGIYAHLV
jgi:hypothetical protein